MAYSKQLFSLNQVLTSTACNQFETNIADHVHGVDSVASSMADITVTGSLTADIFHQNSGNFIQGLLVVEGQWASGGSNQNVNSGSTAFVVGSPTIDTHSAWHDVSSITVPGGFRYARAQLISEVLGGHNNAFAVGINCGSNAVLFRHGYAPNSSETFWNATGGIPIQVTTGIASVKSGDTISLYSYANKGSLMSLGDLLLSVEFFR